MAIALVLMLLLCFKVNSISINNTTDVTGTVNATVYDTLSIFKSENAWNTSKVVGSAMSENSTMVDGVYKETTSDLYNSDNWNDGNDSISDVNWESVMDFLKLETKSVLQSLNISDLIKAVNISEECRRSLQTFLVSLSEWETWAVMMADASGKIPSGVLEGTTLDVGSLEECLKIRVNSTDEVEMFRGRYCMVGYKSPLVTSFYQEPFLTHRDKYIETYGKPPQWIEDFIKRTGKYIEIVSMYLGTCVPSTCSKDDVMTIASNVVSPLGLKVHIPSCKVDEPKLFTTNFIIAICFIGLMTVLCIAGTVIDIVGRYVFENHQDLRAKCFPLYFLTLFSLYLNSEKFFGGNKESNKLSCFNGMRFISCLWILMTHLYFLIGWRLLVFRHFLGVDDDAKGKLRYVLAETGDIAVETFFFISGFLLTYTTWKKLENSNGKLNVFKFMIQKYWRLTPALGVTLSLLIISDHYGYGPIYEASNTGYTKSCYTHWHWNLLYINNWWNDGNICLSHTWFLSALMQLHLVGVILLIISYRSPTAGVIIGSAFVVSSIAFLALVVLWNNFPMPTYFQQKDVKFKFVYGAKVLIQTYVHINSYLFGMALGYLYLKSNDKKLKTHYKALGWILSALLAVYVIEGKYIAEEYEEAVTFYHSIHRTAWCLSIGWVIYMCVTDNGGVINRFLSWDGFSNLSNISYLFYLLHPLVIRFFFTNMRERMYYGDMEMVFLFLMMTVTVCLLAVVAYITVEMPFSAIGNLMFRR